MCVKEVKKAEIDFLIVPICPKSFLSDLMLYQYSALTSHATYRIALPKQTVAVLVWSAGYEDI